jgi:hypothetical protein
MTARDPERKTRFRRSILVAGHWILLNILPGVLTTLILLSSLLAAGEINLRSRLPFNQISWPTQFDQRYGWIFTPGATVNWTNHIDYWTSTKVNSIGFLDREPPAAGAHPGVCRIAFIGDSFVEAAQVAIPDKFHVVFEQMANMQIQYGRRVQTFALGLSATGQSNQLPYYDVFARPLTPDVVVLVFVLNDFANNSTWLESIRNGWGPLHPPRLFFEPGTIPGTFAPLPIDPLWVNYILPPAPNESGHPPSWISYLSGHSYLYNWLYAGFLSNSKTLSAWLTGNPLPWADVYLSRQMDIERMTGNPSMFGNWNPRTVDMDSMFAQPDLPPVFNDALLITGHALDEFKLRSRTDGFHLVIFSSASISTEGQGRMAFLRLKKLASDRGIDLVDQYDYITSKGHDPSEASFKHDPHWNEQGHILAAEALLEYFQSHPDICV